MIYRLLAMIDTWVCIFVVCWFSFSKLTFSKNSFRSTISFKQFGSSVSPTICRAWTGSKLFAKVINRQKMEVSNKCRYVSKWHNMGLDARKPVFGGWRTTKRRQTYASAQGQKVKIQVFHNTVKLHIKLNETRAAVDGTPSQIPAFFTYNLYLWGQGHTKCSAVPST